MSRLARVALVLVAAAGLGWGCAHKQVREHDWQTYEPAGGWSNYLPPSRIFAPSAARATAFSVSPSTLATPTLSGGLVMPSVGH